MSLLIAAVGFGLASAAVLCLAALGFTLQAGITNVVNLAYGTNLTVGAFGALVGETVFHLDIWLAMLLGALIMGFLSVFLNRAVIDPFIRRGTRHFQMMLVTFALSIVLEYVVVLIWGENFYSYTGVPSGVLNIGPMSFTSSQLLIMGIAALLLLVMHAMLRYTKLGKALRAMADDKELARGCGVNVSRMTDITWFLSGALAGLAGVSLAMTTSSFSEILGSNYLLVVVAAAVLGGAGEPYGAMLGGLIVGVVTEVSTVWIPNEYSDVIALALLVVFCLFRPEGIIAGRVQRSEEL